MPDASDVVALKITHKQGGFWVAKKMNMMYKDKVQLNCLILSLKYMSNNKFVTPVLIIIIAVLGYLLVTQPTTTENPPIENEDIAQASPPELTLPADAQKLSECIPNMGIHYANPADLPFGPIYLVDNDEVVGIDYMINENELEENLIEIGDAKMGPTISMPSLDGIYDHIELTYLEGIEGYEGPHYAVHLYVVSEEEQANLCK